MTAVAIASLAIARSAFPNLIPRTSQFECEFDLAKAMITPRNSSHPGTAFTAFEISSSISEAIASLAPGVSILPKRVSSSSRVRSGARFSAGKTSSWCSTVADTSVAAASSSAEVNEISSVLAKTTAQLLSGEGSTLSVCDEIVASGVTVT